MTREPEPDTRGMYALRPRDRMVLATHVCDLCNAFLLLIEVGPHYRAEHPTDRPSVTALPR